MISVCMATFNGAKYIQKQIDSILIQLSQQDELIISDDGSTDPTVEIINNFHDDRIKLLSHKSNKKLLRSKSGTFKEVAANFENALNVARGDFIFLSDQDDIWSKNKVKRCLELMETYDIVMTNFSIINENDTITTMKFYNKSPINQALLKNIKASHFLGCCMAFNRSVLNYVLPFPKKLVGHDFWIGCLGVLKFKFCFIDEPLHSYRRMGENVSTSTGKSKNLLIYKLYYRIVFLFQILCHLIKKGKHDEKK